MNKSVPAKIYLSVFFLSMLCFGVLNFQNCSPANFTTTDPSGLNVSGSPLCVGAGCGTAKQLNSMGLVANHMKCAMCHVDIIGGVAATSPNPFSLRADSSGTIFGSVFVNYPLQEQTSDPLHILHSDARGTVMVDRANPANSIVVQDSAHQLQFTPFKTDKIKAAVVQQQGTVSQGGSTIISQIYQGNLFLDGKAAPILLNGEVYVTGDLIIRGQYRGIGTIYVEGNIYIPDDVTAADNGSLFESFKGAVSDRARQSTLARQAIADQLSALRLASGQSVYLGNLGVTGTAATSILPPDSRLTNYFATTYRSYYTGETLQSRRYDANDAFSRSQFATNYMDAQNGSNGIGYDTSNRTRVYSWYPNYLSLLKPEFELGTSAQTAVCGGKQYRVEIGSVARVDAVLYAQSGVAGLWGGGANFVINGGIITQNLAVLGVTAWQTINSPGGNLLNDSIWELHKVCPNQPDWQLSPDTINPFNNLKLGSNELRYDYRLGEGGAGFDIMRGDNY